MTTKEEFNRVYVPDIQTYQGVSFPTPKPDMTDDKDVIGDMARQIKRRVGMT